MDLAHVCTISISETLKSSLGYVHQMATGVTRPTAFTVYNISIGTRVDKIYMLRTLFLESTKLRRKVGWKNSCVQISEKTIERKRPLNALKVYRIAILLKRHGPFVAFYFYCKIMLYGINYTYYSVKTVKIGFHVPFRG